MKILLIEPPKAPSTIGGEDVFIFEPLALEYLAAGVSNEHEIQIIDMRIDKDLVSALNGFRPDIVGITAYTVHVNVVKGLFEQIKAWSSDTLTVVGGHHATVKPDDFLSPFIDIVVMGEGVPVFKEIVTRFETGQSLEGIEGTILQQEGTASMTVAQAEPQLDDIPFPERRLTAKYRHDYYSEWMRPLASIRTSKGCPFRCKFCAQWKVAKGGYYKRDLEKIVEELAGIDERNVFFADDESLIDAPRMKRLAEMIMEAGIHKHYFLYGRSDTIRKNPDLLRAWRDIGLKRVFIGLEFFRDEDLDFINKSTTSKDNDDAVRILQELGIDVYASFIVRQEFTKEDFASLRKYCQDLNLNFASFAVLTPLPGTDLYEEVADQLIDYNYDHCDFIHTLLPTTLPLKEFYKEFGDLYKKGFTLKKQLSFLFKHQLKEIPSVLARGRKFYNRLDTAYLDYENR